MNLMTEWLNVRYFLEEEKTANKEKNFVKAWFAWKELVRGLSLMDLRLYRSDVDHPIVQEERNSALKDHKILVCAALALGPHIKTIASGIREDVLQLASYDLDSVECMMETLEESHRDFHQPVNQEAQEALSRLFA